MFSVKDGRGFQITFENGYTVSVQFGAIHKCDNEVYGIKALKHLDKLAKDCVNADVALWFGDEKIKWRGHYQNPKEVLETLIYAESLPNPKEKE
tara:strand:- start:220 stop:501 length:282 start_codon:yes stop_codon:yes gene_type:complete